MERSGITWHWEKEARHGRYLLQTRKILLDKNLLNDFFFCISVKHGIHAAIKLYARGFACLGLWDQTRCGFFACHCLCVQSSNVVENAIARMSLVRVGDSRSRKEAQNSVVGDAYLPRRNCWWVGGELSGRMLEVCGRDGRDGREGTIFRRLRRWKVVQVVVAWIRRMIFKIRIYYYEACRVGWLRVGVIWWDYRYA